MEGVEPFKEPSILERIRSMWEFANLVQWIFIFGRAVKIDENLDVEVSHLDLLLYLPHRSLLCRYILRPISLGY